MDDIENKVMQENQNLVHYLIKRYFPLYAESAVYDYDDIFQQGMIALLKAHRAYNPDLGIKFSTLACTSILNGLRHYFRHLSTAKMTQCVISLSAPIAKADGTDTNVAVSVEDFLVDKHSDIDKSFFETLHTLEKYLTDDYFTVSQLALLKEMVKGNTRQRDLVETLGMSHTMIYKTLLAIRPIVKAILGGKIVDVKKMRTQRRVDNSEIKPRQPSSAV